MNTLLLKSKSESRVSLFHLFSHNKGKGWRHAIALAVVNKKTKSNNIKCVSQDFMYAFVSAVHFVSV